ncbi:class I SAM-dependent methyltransferase [Flavobacterium suncheonense]|uniref:Methyltransferase type 11 n=1 Tax=Flavobacterium suncheonense GH29-5 = DSM 17707 TaxID=1121899 RepID=A0A0A2M9X8_9FLAO|nr:class I SAM-dependent methyltransferase [Flavobacterium suncheonense]KGO89069.1 hypothetical protein Q764_09775 [Flavobacterium suncheonense GH29-5 = DSM 17707]
MDINTFTSDLILQDGIHFSKHKNNISYPEKGNDDCFVLEDKSFWFNHRNRCILEAFQKYSKQNLFFDIGGGNGYVSQHMEKAGVDTVLVEPGVNGCLNAAKRGLKNIVCATLQEANFKPESLPNAGVFDVVEHIENDMEFLQMIHGYLQPGGLLYVTVPAYQALWSNEDEDAGHYRRYTLKSMQEVLKKAGFEITYSSYLFSLLPLPIFLSRSLPSRLGMHKNSNDLDKYKNEHTVKSGFMDKVLNKIWDKEIQNIKLGKKTAFGSSCFIVAKKKI